MDDMVARCPDCGFKHDIQFAPCPACGRSEVSDWWCNACTIWCRHRACPACMGVLVAPGELALGAAPVGTTVLARFTVRNTGKRPLDVPLSADACVSLKANRLTIRAGAEAVVHCQVALGELSTGPHTFVIRYHAPVPVESRLVVEVIPAVTRLEFAPSELIVQVPTPGKLAHVAVTITNTGNLPVAATVVGSESWLHVQPGHVALEPGKRANLRVSVRTRKTEFTSRTGLLLVMSGSATAWEAVVRAVLPEPVLDAGAVDLGEVLLGRSTVGQLMVRNIGTNRAVCTVSCDQPWLTVAPGDLTLAPGKEKSLQVRARFTRAVAGVPTGNVVFTMGERQLLCVPVTACCRVPKPVLGAVRRQTLGAVANDAAVVRRFRVSNTGDGRLECTITTEQAWVEVLTRELAVAPGKRRRIELRLNTPAMAKGANRATIRICSNGGNADVPLSLTVVDPDPELEVLSEPELVTATGDQPATGYIAVRNTGVGLLMLRAVPEDPRVTITPLEMKLAPGPPARMTVAVAVGGLSGGVHTFGVQFTSNGGSRRGIIRCRLPAEAIEAPVLIDLGDRAAGRPTGSTLRVRNPGTDPVTLHVRAEHPWLRPGAARVTVRPGEMLAIPFRVDLQPGETGRVESAIRLEGRALRHAVGLQLTARKYELAVIPQTLALGDMTSGEERVIPLQVVNTGEMVAEVREIHVGGELEVWLRRQTVPPGVTGMLAVRVRVNGGAVGKHLQVVVALTDDLSAQITARVVRSWRPRVVAAVIAGAAFAVGGVLGATIGWAPGAAVVACGVVAAAVILARAGAQ